jgi:hypothetical protein
MEIRFCSVCNESIPDGEFDAGRALVSGKKSQHVACALKKSVEQSGPRSWMTLLLALFGAAVAAYLLIVHLGEPEGPPELTNVPAVVENRIAEVARESETRMVARGTKERRSMRAELSEDFKGQLDGWLKGAVRQAIDAQDARLRDTSRNVDDELRSLDARLDKVQQQMAQLLEWKRNIEDEAEALRRELDDVSSRRVPEPRTPSPAEVRQANPQPQPPAPTPPDVEREKEIDRWIKRLRDSDEDIVFSATIELARLKALRATPALVKVLRSHKDFYARLGAATALGEIQSVDAVPDLIEALNDKDDLVRTAASEALHRITGQDFNFVSGLTKNERVRIQKKWRAWWRENEDGLRTRLGQPKTK